jgi:hypothetical protein
VRALLVLFVVALVVVFTGGLLGIAQRVADTIPCRTTPGACPVEATP